MSADPVVLSYEGCQAYPVGTSVADAEGYWARAVQRHYVKTTANTWAFFSGRPTVEQADEAVREKRNNLSPCPSGYLAYVILPERPVARTVAA